MVVTFELAGQEFMVLNGGPHFKFTEATSFVINCKTQEEVDYFWEKLTDGGEESRCGWLKDKYSLSWQVVPIVLDEMLRDEDAAKSRRVMEAMLKMDDLKNAFAELGFRRVKTLLASGNVLFETSSKDPNTVSNKIRKGLESTFGYEIGVLVRWIEDLRRLAGRNPFSGIEVTPQTRLYVTFLPENTKSDLKIPYESPDKNFRIIQASESEICSVLTLTPNSGTLDLMDIVEKEYGKEVTTRNWNTINRILKASA